MPAGWIDRRSRIASGFCAHEDQRRGSSLRDSDRNRCKGRGCLGLGCACSRIRHGSRGHAAAGALRPDTAEGCPATCGFRGLIRHLLAVRIVGSLCGCRHGWAALRRKLHQHRASGQGHWTQGRHADANCRNEDPSQHQYFSLARNSPIRHAGKCRSDDHLTNPQSSTASFDAHLPSRVCGNGATSSAARVHSAGLLVDRLGSAALRPGQSGASCLATNRAQIGPLDLV